ncbi:hypothetical protein BGZ97_012463 [Linnemannia gamsii]|jgi:hypothetical protein|uniref:Uncharacterized protein n=1 Tax=Linnemannia gamsii TaxID=64522 RepID=A0A9P6ULV9_9FUNG|nr:hypothetical protein BGZ97_012463 [Linnemannia gamsii]
MLIASHSPQLANLYPRDNSVSNTLCPSTHKPNWTSESITVSQRGQQQQQPVYGNRASWAERVDNTNSGYSDEHDNTTIFSGDNRYNNYNNHYRTTADANTPQTLAAYRKPSQVYETHYTQQQEQQQQGWPSEYQAAVRYTGHNNRATQNTTKYPSYSPSPHMPLLIVESYYPQQEQQGQTSWIELNNGARYYYHTGAETAKAKPTRSSSATSLESSSTDHTRFTQEQQGQTSWIELNNGARYDYHTGAETAMAKPTRSSSATSLESSSTDHTRFPKEKQQLRGQGNEYQTAIGYNYQHHSVVAMSQVGNQEHPELRGLPWAYTNSGLGIQWVNNTTFSNDNLHCNYYGTTTETTTPEPFALFTMSSLTHHTRFLQEQPLYGQRSGYQATFDTKHHCHGATKDFVEHSCSSSHESNLPRQIRFLHVQQQDRVHEVNDNGTYSNNSPRNWIREKRMYCNLTNAHEPRSIHQSRVCQQQHLKMPYGNDAKLPAPIFSHSRDALINYDGYQAYEDSMEPCGAQEHCFLPHHQQQIQGYEVSDHAADKGNINIYSATTDTAQRTVDSATPAAAPSSLSSSITGFLLTAEYYPSDIDDDRSEWLLKEESSDSKRYPARFGRFVAYERYKVELERAQCERQQKIAARARAIEKAKIESIEKFRFREKNKSKVKSTITEVLFGHL